MVTSPRASQIIRPYFSKCHGSRDSLPHSENLHVCAWRFGTYWLRCFRTVPINNYC